MCEAVMSIVYIYICEAALCVGVCVSIKGIKKNNRKCTKIQMICLKHLNTHSHTLHIPEFMRTLDLLGHFKKLNNLKKH